MRFLIIEGNVVGGHRIEDLGLTVPYKEEVRVQYERSNWSGDLAYALLKKLVIKKGVVEGHPQHRPPVQIKAPKSSPPVHQPRKTLPLKKDKVEDSGEADLKTLNIQLMEQLSEMAKNQAALMEKMESLITKGVSVQNSPAYMSSNTTTTSSPMNDTIIDDVVYVPSSIRTGKATANLDIQGESLGGKGQLDKASEALKAMRGGRKTRKKDES